MISSALTPDEDLENNNLIKLDWAKFIREKYEINPRIISTKYDDRITSIISSRSDQISTIDALRSTDVSYYLFSQSRPYVNEYNSKNLSKKIHRSDSVDWTNHRSEPTSIRSTVNNQLNTIDYFREYLQNGKSDVLIDLLDEVAREIHPHEYSAMNNNHFHSASMLNSNLQFSNNKEKKNKKKKSDANEKKDDTDIETKKSKKSKTKSEKIEETTTTDSESDVHPLPPPPSLYSPVETTAFPSLSIPVPHSSIQSFISPDSSRVHSPQPSNIAHLSQVQEQLQTDSQNPSLNRTTYPHNISVQQQLQSLSQMARDGDEILITLSVNALTQKQQMNDSMNDIQQDQLSRYAPQVWNPVDSSRNGMLMPRNLEIVAKGFARVQHKHPHPLPSNPYLQQLSVTPSYNQQPQTLVHPSFASRYPMPCYWSSGPPQMPIAPAIQPIFPSSITMIPDQFNRPANPANLTSSRRNYSGSYDRRAQLHTGKCDYICQSSLTQPDFRGRPSPGVIINPYIPPSSMNFSAKHSSRKHQSHNLNFEDINRIYSSIY